MLFVFTDKTNQPNPKQAATNPKPDKTFQTNNWTKTVKDRGAVTVHYRPLVIKSVTKPLVANSDTKPLVANSDTKPLVANSARLGERKQGD